MSVKIAANGKGEIYYSEGNVHDPYGIASLSKVWACVLLFDCIQASAAQKSRSIDSILNDDIVSSIDYEPMVYTRMDQRDDLIFPDDPLTYRPFRREKASFRLPVQKGQAYTVRNLFEATLFQSKNDAAQLLADSFFACDDNQEFRLASRALSEKLGLKNTKIGDPHGLCDGDNVSSAYDLVKFCSFILSEGYLDIFSKFDPYRREHTAQHLLENHDMRQRGIQIILAKTATGNNRHGNDSAQSLLVIAKKDGKYDIVVTLTDTDKIGTAIRLLVS